jgi:hypothetical protein
MVRSGELSLDTCRSLAKAESFPSHAADRLPVRESAQLIHEVHHKSHAFSASKLYRSVDGAASRIGLFRYNAY